MAFIFQFLLVSPTGRYAAGVVRVLCPSLRESA